MAASLKICRLAQLGLGKPKLNLKQSFSKYQTLRQLNSVSKTQLEQEKKWQLHGAVLLQRNPIVSMEMNPFEVKYQDYLDEVETDKSLYSDHELYDARVRKKSLEKQEAEKTKKKSKEDVLLTAAELEDAWRKEREQFQLTDRTTDADKNNDSTSLDRKLEKRLFLIVKQKWSPDGKTYWSFPHIQRQGEESMRETAERALRTYCGEGIKAQFLGNAPVTYEKYKLPEGHEEYGVKLFFFKADYQSGEVVHSTKQIVDHKWVTIEEMAEYFKPSTYEIFYEIFAE
ncbi:hypothetical protein ACF0H5_013943 [Mactra antiquata]